jgi:hypothetical protein
MAEETVTTAGNAHAGTVRATTGGPIRSGGPAADVRPQLRERLVAPAVRHVSVRERPALAGAVTAMEAVQIAVRPEPGAGWWRCIPARLWFALVVITAPLRALVMVLDALVAVCVLAVMGVGWAWWTQRITDDQVAQVLGQLGARGLSILSKSGVL